MAPGALLRGCTGLLRPCHGRADPIAAPGPLSLRAPGAAPGVRDARAQRRGAVPAPAPRLRGVLALRPLRRLGVPGLPVVAPLRGALAIGRGPNIPRRRMERMPDDP